MVEFGCTNAVVFSPCVRQISESYFVEQHTLAKSALLKLVSTKQEMSFFALVPDRLAHAPILASA